ncbi:uncharacterized protein C12orf45-like isoform X2 [Acanthaster planci]|uniref:Uncharacterized protein C12orf45-like isoform X2 n=1 Tax=Acanthaster planci TaxID=133434 RepID=A0A8B7Z890_ACAPL|nr:uncharacterized protein C12orf45-like isoform X2 [Acanthaster planci]
MMERNDFNSSIDQTRSKDLLDVGKTTNVLSQVKSFLPKMQEANSQLEERLKTVPSEELDIENITGHEKEVIEMNLALFHEDDDSSGEDNDDDDKSQNSSSDENSDEELSLFSEVTTTNIKLPNGSRKPHRTMIEELSEVKEHDLKSEVKLDSG